MNNKDIAHYHLPEKCCQNCMHSYYNTYGDACCNNFDHVDTVELGAVCDMWQPEYAGVEAVEGMSCMNCKHSFAPRGVTLCDIDNLMIVDANIKCNSWEVADE